MDHCVMSVNGFSHSGPEFAWGMAFKMHICQHMLVED